MAKYNTPEIESDKRELYETTSKIKELENDIKSNPLRHYLPLLTRRGMYKGEVHTITKSQYRRFLRREPKQVIIDKSGRIPWHYALDELASNAGLKSDEALKENVEKLSSDIKLLKRLKSNKKQLKTDIANKERTPPKPESTKLNSMEPPVFPKNENTRGEVTTYGQVEITSRRNPSFWQTEVDKDNDNKPDITLRVRYKKDADKLTRAAISDARLSISKGKRSRISPKIPKLR